MYFTVFLIWVPLSSKATLLINAQNTIKQEPAFSQHADSTTDGIEDEVSRDEDIDWCGDLQTTSKFIDSAVDHVKNLGLDSVDIDWGYPTNDEEASNYVLLLKELRTALDTTYAEKSASRYHSLITRASPAWFTHYQQQILLATEGPPLLNRETSIQALQIEYHANFIGPCN